jgi:hypothetical protein
MNITLDNPILEAAAATFTAKINAARPKDEDGEFIDPPQTVVDVLTANLAAIVASWKETQDADLRAAMASNPRIIALGAAVVAQLDKLDDVEAAVTQALS